MTPGIDVSFSGGGGGGGSGLLTVLTVRLQTDINPLTTNHVTSVIQMTVPAGTWLISACLTIEALKTGAGYNPTTYAQCTCFVSTGPTLGYRLYAPFGIAAQKEKTNATTGQVTGGNTDVATFTTTTTLYLLARNSTWRCRVRANIYTTAYTQRSATKILALKIAK